MPEQINLLGTPDQPTDLALGPVQREVLRFAREHGTISKDEAGQIAHARLEKHRADETCKWCGVDGAPILRSLIGRKRLVKRRDGLAQLPATDSRSQGGEIPF
jgi:hypothetical protein